MGASVAGAEGGRGKRRGSRNDVAEAKISEAAADKAAAAAEGTGQP